MVEVDPATGTIIRRTRNGAVTSATSEAIARAEIGRRTTVTGETPREVLAAAKREAITQSIRDTGVAPAKLVKQLEVAEQQAVQERAEVTQLQQQLVSPAREERLYTQAPEFLAGPSQFGQTPALEARAQLTSKEQNLLAYLDQLQGLPFAQRGSPEAASNTIKSLFGVSYTPGEIEKAVVRESEASSRMRVSAAPRTGLEATVTRLGAPGVYTREELEAIAAGTTIETRLPGATATGEVVYTPPYPVRYEPGPRG